MKILYIINLFISLIILFVGYIFSRDKSKYIKFRIYKLENQATSNKKGLAISLFNLSTYHKNPYFVVNSYKILKKIVPKYRLTMEDYILLFESSICSKDEKFSMELWLDKIYYDVNKLGRSETDRIKLLFKWRYSKSDRIELASKIDTYVFSINYIWLDNYVRAILYEQENSIENAKKWFIHSLSCMPPDMPDFEVATQRYEYLVEHSE